MKHLHCLMMLPAPLVLAAVYWLVVDQRTGTMDWALVAVGVAVGLVGIWLAPWSKKLQVAAALAYVPLMGFTLAASVLFFECSTGNCL